MGKTRKDAAALGSKDLTTPQPVLVIIIKGVTGGVGGTLTAMLIASSYHAMGSPVAVGALDSQRRIEHQLVGLPVRTFSPEVYGQGDDPVSAMVSPLYEDAISHLLIGSNYVIDQAATRSTDTLRIAAEAGLSDDVSRIGARVVAVAVGVATEDSLRETASSLREARIAFPDADLAYVENRRDGAIADLMPGTAAYTAWTKELRPELEGVHCTHLPRVRARSMQAFELAELSPVTMVGLDIDEIARRTRLPRLQVQLARGDFQALLGQVIQGLGSVLGLPRLQN